MEHSAVAQASEADLVRRAVQGESVAWEALMRRHQEPVFRFAYLILGDADEADDIAQEAFIRAYHALQRFDTARPLRPWLLSIAANLARNRRRSLGRYLAALNRLLQAEPSHKPNVEEKSSQRWEAQTLWQAVQNLSDTDQQVVYLRYFLELSTEEVAETMKIPKGTVKSRLHRALQRLRGVIEQDFPGLLEGSDG